MYYTQYDFRPGMSAVNTIHYVYITSTCFDYIEMNIITGLILLDRNKALDTVQRKTLLG